MSESTAVRIAQALEQIARLIDSLIVRESHIDPTTRDTTGAYIGKEP